MKIFFNYCCQLIHGTVQKTMLQHVTLFIYLCVWKRGSMLFFSPWWGGVMQFYRLGIGGGSIFFFWLWGTVCHPPSVEIYEQSLSCLLTYLLDKSYSNPPTSNINFNTGRNTLECIIGAPIFKIFSQGSMPLDPPSSGLSGARPGCKTPHSSLLDPPLDTY